MQNKLERYELLQRIIYGEIKKQLETETKISEVKNLTKRYEETTTERLITVVSKMGIVLMIPIFQYE